MLADRAGSPLANTLEVRASRSKLRRLIRQLAEPTTPTPRVLGVDEFALRQGHVYGKRRPVDLLPGRSVKTVARWLADHPGVDVIYANDLGADTFSRCRVGGLEPRQGRQGLSGCRTPR